MTELVLDILQGKSRLGAVRGMPHFKGMLLMVGLFVLLTITPELRLLTLNVLSDAYIQVSAFVAGTLFLVYSIERLAGFSLSEKMARAGKWQVPMAAFLGALPGCGGAIIVVTQYTKGMISFGALVSVLIATMGDAAFLIIAREPSTGALLMGLGLIVGTLSGWFVDHTHGQSFMRATPQSSKHKTDKKATQAPSNLTKNVLAFSNHLWVWLLVPGVVLGLLAAFQIELSAPFGLSAIWSPNMVIGVIGCLLCLLMWSFSNQHASLVGQDQDDVKQKTPMMKRIIQDTNFVTAWVFLAFISYELLAHFTGGGLAVWMQGHAVYLIALAIMVGFIPGCGPQIVVAQLYLSGVVPPAALFGNAIANDGDALFPALALAPKAATLATVYSAIPAVIVAYTIYVLN